jgi:hypothetical protein
MLQLGVNGVVDPVLAHGLCSAFYIIVEALLSDAVFKLELSSERTAALVIDSGRALNSMAWPKMNPPQG